MKGKDMKYWILGLSLLAGACSNMVEVDQQADFKCGDNIVKISLLDDDSMILQMNGINNVLTKIAFSGGEKYENSVSGVSFTEQDGEHYLTVNGQSYPACKKIKR